MREETNALLQKKAPDPVKIPAEAFGKREDTAIYWLGNGGALVNARGTCIMMDPLLEGFDMPLLVEAPITPEETGELSAVLITHCDNDHLSRTTCRKLSEKCGQYGGPHYVAELLREAGLPASGYDIWEKFSVGRVRITLTPADHAWQNESKKHATRLFQTEDYCGFWLETPDGTVWMPGDSRLMEEQLHMPSPDVILLDFSDSRWHIGLDGAIKLCRAYPDAVLIPIHWGCVDAPSMAEFNGDPEELRRRIVNPGRLHLMAPGEPFILKKR